eukprot:TRINITY_DN6608_c0_g1_i2.p1 TRINITY_DN6608_c0_g1~~TRINITY_DN6608_c0_g1_i2.p1  ORF type:complete len:186 (+),score=10.33 TRINITY_DN6608_c0_g1_i2:50-607(+)
MVKIRTEDLKKIARIFSSIFPTEYEAYFCLYHFLCPPGLSPTLRKQDITNKTDTLVKLVLSVDGEIITALASKNILLDDFSRRWFKTHFACCFPDKSLIALWDKVMAISPNLEILVALCILQSKKKEIVSKSPQHLREYLSSLMLSPTQASGIIVKMMESQGLLKSELFNKHVEAVARYYPLNNF